MNVDANSLRGTFPALVTPFSSDGGAVDYVSLRALVDRQVQAGVQGVVVCGSTGEAATLSEDEYREVVSRTAEYLGGRGTCIAGIGTNDTKRARDAAKALPGYGVDAILLVGPPYNKPPQRGIAAHFREVRTATTIPVLAYNIPGRSACNILPATLADLASDGTIIGIKESTGNMDQVMDLFAALRTPCAVLSGEDSLVLSLMVAGGVGVISAVANVIPEIFVQIVNAGLSGDWETARMAQLKALPVIRAMFCETNPIPVKTALAMQGIIASPAVRLPLVPAEPSTIDRMRGLL